MRCPSCGEDSTDGYCWHCGEEFPEGFSEETNKRRNDGTEYSEGRTRSSPDAYGMAAITHLLGLFTWIFGALLVFLVTEDDFVKKNAASALNWQISLTVYLFVSLLLIIILIGFLTTVLLFILDLLFCVIAAAKAANGEKWDPPFTMEFV